MGVKFIKHILLALNEYLLSCLRGKKTYILLILVFTQSGILFSQEFKRQYKSAKEFYDDRKYNFAMDAFKPLMVYDQANPYTEYASYYYALSAYNQNYFTVAKETLLQIKNLYPEWDQIDEVNYWLAAVYFQEGEHFQALRMLYAMKSPRDLASMERMKNNYLLKIYDDEVIQLILEEFPGESALLRRLITRLIVKGEYEKANKLIESNGLDARDFNFPKKKKVVFKDQYRVAALFPFLTGTLDPSPGLKRNQSTLDLYQGMKLAADSLNRLGVSIDLAGYDTERQAETVARLMSLDEMKSADVLIGPLFTDEMTPVVEFSKANQVPMVNPVSNNADYISGNSNALLIQPDYAAIGAASAEALSREITRVNSSAVYTTLVNPTRFDKFRNPIEFQLKKDSISSIFVASDDELIFTKVISSVDRRGDSVIIVGQDSWIDKPSMDLDKFERLHIMMSSPGYTNVFSPTYQAFRKRYAAEYGVMPSTFAKTGFEFMMLIGTSLKEYGSEFISGLQKSNTISGALGKTYRFQEAQCNKEVPFVIFQYGELQMLY